MCAAMKRPKEVAVMSVIDMEDDCLSDILIEEKMSMYTLIVVLMNIPEDGINKYKDTMNAL